MCIFVLFMCVKYFHKKKTKTALIPSIILLLISLKKISEYLCLIHINEIRSSTIHLQNKKTTKKQISYIMHFIILKKESTKKILFLKKQKATMKIVVSFIILNQKTKFCFKITKIIYFKTVSYNF